MKEFIFLLLAVGLLSCHHRSDSSTECLSDETAKSLVALGQLWGFLKYHHPAVAEGKFDWDGELVAVIPTVMQAKTEDEWKKILDDWMDTLPVVPASQKDTVELSEFVVRADYGELFNPDFFHQHTINQLKYILNNAQSAENQYIKLNPQRHSNEPFITITNEAPYDEMAFPELPYRLLALFRYWNIVNYFFPYRELCDTKWSTVLQEMLPDFVCAQNQKEYTLACMKLCAKIDDSHGFFQIHDTAAYFDIYGRNSLPFDVRFVENKLVVTSFSSDSVGMEELVSVGDIITAINGVDVEAAVERLLPITPASNYEGKLREIARRILWTNDSVLSIQFLHNGKLLTKTMQTFDTKVLKSIDHFNPRPNEVGYSIRPDSIGYILPSNCRPEEREKEVARLMFNTKGLIIDLRCYPSDYNAMSIAPYLMKNWGYYCRQSHGSISKPGYFSISKEYALPEPEIGSYPYPVVVLVNEYTQSSAEDHTFFYYPAPQLTIIGSTTAGANGAVFGFSLPGGFTAYMTGIGMYYPDGGCMHRVGVRIDEEVRPTIEGIKLGIDEVLERAVRIVL